MPSTVRERSGLLNADVSALVRPLFFIIGWLAASAGLVLFAYVLKEEGDLRVAAFFGAGPCAVGWVFFLMARQVRARTEDLAFLEDDRAPVLIIRPTGVGDIMPTFHAGPLTWLLLPFAKTEEEMLVAGMSKIAPVVAIAAPGAMHVPTPGASRLFLAEDRWVSVVEQLVQAASLVVVVVDDAERGQEALKVLLDGAPLERLVILTTPTEAPRLKELMSGRVDLSSLNVHVLADKALHFARDGRPQLSRSRSFSLVARGPDYEDLASSKAALVRKWAPGEREQLTELIPGTTPKR